MGGRVSHPVVTSILKCVKLSNLRRSDDQFGCLTTYVHTWLYAFVTILNRAYTNSTDILTAFALYMKRMSSSFLDKNCIIGCLWVNHSKIITVSNVLPGRCSVESKRGVPSLFCLSRVRRFCFGHIGYKIRYSVLAR